MTRPPTVSVLVPVHNQERFIGRCLRSLLAQHFPRQQFEIVVIDDGSTDRTPYALDLFRDDITLVRNDHNLGLPASLNRGIRATSAPFVVRVDSDDYVNADFIRLLHLFLSSNSYMDAVACDYLVVDDRDELLARKSCFEDPIACGILLRCVQLIDVGLYDEEFPAARGTRPAHSLSPALSHLSTRAPPLPVPPARDQWLQRLRQDGASHGPARHQARDRSDVTS